MVSSRSEPSRIWQPRTQRTVFAEILGHADIAFPVRWGFWKAEQSGLLCVESCISHNSFKCQRCIYCIFLLLLFLVFSLHHRCRCWTNFPWKGDRRTPNSGSFPSCQVGETRALRWGLWRVPSVAPGALGLSSWGRCPMPRISVICRNEWLRVCAVGYMPRHLCTGLGETLHLWELPFLLPLQWE